MISNRHNLLQTILINHPTIIILSSIYGDHKCVIIKTRPPITAICTCIHYGIFPISQLHIILFTQ